MTAASDALPWYSKVYIRGQVAGGYFPWNRSETITLSKTENPKKRLQEIPLFKFIMNLLEVYRNSKDKLTLECFENETFTIPIKLKNIE